MSWYRFDPARRRVTLTLHIQPNARVSAVAGPHGDALKIRIHAPAVDNQANAELIDFLHQWFKLPIQHIKIKRGTRGRRKIVELEDAGPAIVTLLDRIDSPCPANLNNA
jgi:hypothetical protein